jgi:hypothetical protein
MWRAIIAKEKSIMNKKDGDDKKAPKLPAVPEKISLFLQKTSKLPAVPEKTSFLLQKTSKLLAVPEKTSFLLHGKYPALKKEIDKLIEKIGEDETCDDKFYSLEKLRNKYPVDWEYWESLNQYTYNNCILFLVGIDPKINKIISENYENHSKIKDKLDELLRDSTFECLPYYLSYYLPYYLEKDGILERFFKVLKIEQSYLVNKNPIPSFEEVKKDFDEYNPNKEVMKKEEFKKIAADLKIENHDRYEHIPNSFLTNESIENNYKQGYRRRIFFRKLAECIKEEILKKASKEIVTTPLLIRFIEKILGIKIEKRSDKNKDKKIPYQYTLISGYLEGIGIPGERGQEAKIPKDLKMICKNKCFDKFKKEFNCYKG